GLLSRDSEVANESDVNLTLHIGPLRRLTQPDNELLERFRLSWGVLEPGQEVKWLAKVATVVKPAGNSRKVFEPGGDMPRSLFEDLAACVRGVLPPGVRFPARDGCGRGGRCTDERLRAPE